MKVNFVFVVFSLLLFLSSCGKNKKCSRGYDFEHPVSVYPVKDSYAVGDTIWIELDFSNQLNALVTNNFTGEQFYQTVQLEHFDFRRNFCAIWQITDSSKQLNEQNTATWNSFTALLENIDIVHIHPSGPEYKLKYITDRYKMKLGLVLLTPGRFIYRPGFGQYYPAAEGQMNEQDISPVCEREIITNIYFPVNRQPNGTHLTNYHLFEQVMNTSLENDLNRIQTQCFTFVVN